MTSKAELVMTKIYTAGPLSLFPPCGSTTTGTRAITVPVADDSCVVSTVEAAVGARVGAGVVATIGGSVIDHWVT